MVHAEPYATYNPQSRGTVTVRIEQFADLGPLSYAIRLLGLGPDYFDPVSIVSVTAPDGTQFSASRSLAGRLTLDQIVACFTGEWTINDTQIKLPGTPVQRHQFSVAANHLTKFPTSFPAITSPPNGAMLPARFDFTSTGNGIEIFAPDLSYTGPGPNRSYFIHSSILLPKAARARTSIGICNSLGDAVPLDSSPAKTFSSAVQTFNYSPYVQWTIGVPEPATFGMAGTGLLALAAIRRRK